MQFLICCMTVDLNEASFFCLFVCLLFFFVILCVACGILMQNEILIAQVLTTAAVPLHKVKIVLNLWFRKTGVPLHLTSKSWMKM